MVGEQIRSADEREYALSAEGAGNFPIAASGFIPPANFHSQQQQRLTGK
jgi:hypothetical protein